MPVPTIKSRPVYAPLVVRPGMLHVMVADHDGASAIVDLAARAGTGFFERTQVLHVASPSARTRRTEELRSVKPRDYEEISSVDDMLPRLAASLASAFMGTLLYIAGTEGLIGRSTKVALDAGMALDSIQAEHRGSEARRVQCVHCKGITENVTTQPCTCARCGLMLFVRDHYSRRIAAFQGVCIDAEEPGTAPLAEEVFR